MNATKQVISFYIPRVLFSYSENDIKYAFKLLNIGEVKRIDFSSIAVYKDKINNNNIVKNDDIANYQSAFVHLLYMFDTDIANDILNYTNNGKTYKLWVEDNVFWWILKNKNPISDTNLNIHQVVENARLLEEKVTKQEQQITQMQDTIYQLLGVIFNKKTDMGKIHGHYNYMKFGNYYKKRWLLNEDDIGDENGEYDDEYDDDDTILSDSTHNSMPSLISMSNNSDDDSAQKRIQFSREYCDNH